MAHESQEMEGGYLVQEGNVLALYGAQVDGEKVKEVPVGWEAPCRRRLAARPMVA